MISVIICTHNPLKTYLTRTLAALKEQTLALQEWELILIDNASQNPVAEQWDISWHPNARHVMEPELGLTAARLRGIRESAGEVLVFVDDDNVLDSTYVRYVLEISNKWSILGAWGGRIDPEFEIAPPEWTRNYWYLLAVRDVKKEVWGNDNIANALPCGAGMCVRRQVAIQYEEALKIDSVRRALDRTGSSMGSCGDTDLALTACDLGMGYGLFPFLQLTHLIPQERLSEEYLLKLYEGIESSGKLMMERRGIAVNTSRPSLSKRVLDFLRYLRLNERERKFWKIRHRVQN